MGKLVETELTPEEVSLFMDGELDAERSARICGALRESVPLATWEQYHVIGDVLRGCGNLRAGFHARFAASLDAEATVETVADGIARLDPAPDHQRAVVHQGAGTLPISQSRDGQG